MNTNITTDNYEAYLLDYMEGNLSPDEAELLKAFVVAQGLDWDELTAPLPYLETPEIVYDGKEKLKQRSLSLSKGISTDHRPIVIPLYVKIASAAAAAGLLLTVTLWPEKQMPKLEPIANLRPIEALSIDDNEPLALLPRQITESRSFQLRPVRSMESMLSETTSKERGAAPLLAELPTKNATALQMDLPLATFDEPDFDLLSYHMNNNLNFAQLEGNSFEDDEDYGRDLSLIGKGLLWLTNGRHDSFASLIGSGMDKAKQDLTEAASDLALTAQQRADEYFEQARERWEEKQEE